MNDWFVGAMHVVVVVVVFCVGWALSAATIAGECTSMGMFYVAKTVFECKERGVK